MKKNNEKILKSSLTTLLHRFSGTDIISGLKEEYQIAPSQVSVSSIDDNTVLKKARINEKTLERAMSTISEKGIASPVLIFKHKERYQVLYPRIVLIAAKKLKLDYIPCVLISIPEDEMLVFLAYSLNATKNSSIIELSLILNRLLNKYHYKQVEIASLMNQSRSQINNIMRLTRLPDIVLNDITNNNLSFGHARALVGLKESEQIMMVEKVKTEHLSVRELENYLYAKKKHEPFTEKEKKLSKKYQAKVNLTPNKVTFTFNNPKEREKFIQKLEDKEI